MYKKRILFLVIYSFFIFLLFSYILFPIQSLKQKIETSFAERFPGRLVIQGLSLRFPAHLLMEKAQITFNDEPFVMYLDEIGAVLSLGQIPRGRIGINLDLSVGEGTIHAEIGRKWIGSPFKYLFCKMENVSIQDLPILSKQIGTHMTGLMKAEVNMEWAADDITKSKGNWSFTADKGRIIPAHFPGFNYNSAYGKGLINEQMLEIEHITIQGEDLSLLAMGQVRTDPKIDNFFVETQVKLEIHPKLHKKLGFFSKLLPKPDNEGKINLFIYGPPKALRFSSKKMQ